MSVYIIAMRGERSSEIPAAWVERIKNTSGVADVLTGPGLLRLSASKAALESIRRSFGTDLIIEAAAAYSVQ